jgi:hypothetical protein
MRGVEQLLFLRGEFTQGLLSFKCTNTWQKFVKWWIEQTHRAVADLHVSAEAARQRLDRVRSRLLGGPDAYGPKPEMVEAEENGEIGRLLSEVRKVQTELDRAHELIERLEGL